MKKAISLMIVLLATGAFAQVTRTFNYTNNGSEMSATVTNSAQAAWQVVAMPGSSFSNPCVASPPLTQPYISTASGDSVLFAQNVKPTVSPQNVQMIQLKMTICYSVYGNNMNTINIIMQRKHTFTNIKTDGPIIATIPGGNWLLPGVYLSAEAVWNLPVNSVLSSSLQNHEFGYRIDAGPGPFFGTPGVVKVHKIQTRLVFNPTAMQNPQAAVASYTQLGTFNTSKVNVTQALNAPSNNEEVAVEIRCGNNVYRPLINWSWAQPSPQAASWTMQVINSASYCTSAGATALTPGMSTMIRTRNVTTGTTAFSNNITVL